MCSHNLQVTVGVNSHVIHRNESVFGPDANEFKPERWLTTDTEALSKMERAFMPFGQGARTCVGKHISLLEITKLVPEFVQRFDFKLADTGHFHCHTRWFVKPTRFEVVLRKRGYVD